MSNTKLQFKYLDAGAKSSPVVHDPSLSTSNSQTLYLYHHQRNQIIEYRRDIVETKLRDLSAIEKKELKALEKGFQQARSSFTPRGATALSIPDKAPPAKTLAVNDTLDEDGDNIDLEDD